MNEIKQTNNNGQKQVIKIQTKFSGENTLNDLD